MSGLFWFGNLKLFDFIVDGSVRNSEHPCGFASIPSGNSKGRFNPFPFNLFRHCAGYVFQSLASGKHLIEYAPAHKYARFVHRQNIAHVLSLRAFFTIHTKFCLSTVLKNRTMSGALSLVLFFRWNPVFCKLVVQSFQTDTEKTGGAPLVLVAFIHGPDNHCFFHLFDCQHVWNIARRRNIFQ